MRLKNVTGMGKVIKNLRKVSRKSGMGIERGFKKAGAHILRESQQEVPVDLGHLKGSGFVRKTKGTRASTVVTVGYTADYAVFVHENEKAAHGEEYNRKYAEQIRKAKDRRKKGTKASVRPRGPGQKAKFLEDPAVRNRKKVLLFILEEVSKDL